MTRADAVGMMWMEALLVDLVEHSSPQVEPELALGTCLAMDRAMNGEPLHVGDIKLMTWLQDLLVDMFKARWSQVCERHALRACEVLQRAMYGNGSESKMEHIYTAFAGEYAN